MRKINTILIDDEEGAINTLRGMLQKFCPEVNIVAEARTPSDAVAKINRLKPELLLMDIEMPPFGTSFEILKQIDERVSGIIFITAYPQYAIDAINSFQPWGYLVKPFSVIKLQEVLSIAKEKINEQQEETAGKSETILVETSRSTVMVRIKDIVLCQSEEAMIDVVVEKQGNSEILRCQCAMKEMEQNLQPPTFFRTHHSFIVNLEQINKWEKTGRNGLLHMKNGMRVPISVQKMPLFEANMAAYLEAKNASIASGE